MKQNADATLRGMVLMLGFCMIAPLFDVASKLAAATLPVGQITLARFAVQATLMLPLALVLGLPLGMGRQAWRLTLWRAIFSVLATLTFIASVAVMPIADVLAIVFVEPFIVLLFGWLVFAERAGPRRIGACVLGFAGSLLVIRPGFHTFGTVTLLPLISALFFALYILVTRRLCQEVHPVTMQLTTAAVAAVLCLPLIGIGSVMGIGALGLRLPSSLGWTWLLGVGVASAVSHMLITCALRLASATTLAPLHYFEIVCAVILIYLVFGDFPSVTTWAGIGLIILAGLYVIHREKLAHAAPPAPAALAAVPGAAE